MARESADVLEEENRELRSRLAEAEDTLRAIRAGEVDSLVIEGPEGLRVYALEGVNHSYRVLVEAMSEGAASLSADGTILYCNSKFAYLVDAPLAKVMGRTIYELIAPASHGAFEMLVRESLQGRGSGEIPLLTLDGEERPALLSVSAVDDGGRRVLCLVATDLREHKRAEEAAAAKRRSVLEQAYREELQRMAFEAAQGEERQRRRIAVDLHDRIGQSMALAQIKLGSLRNDVRGPPAEVIRGAVDILAQCSVEMRSLVFELAPPVLYDLGMKAALGWLSEKLEAESGVRVEVTDDGKAKPLDDLTAGLVFRATRELLMNVIKHSKATVSQVSLERVGEDFQILVRDAGEGFDPESVSPAAAPGGFGLFSVREQVRRLGGTVTLSSSPHHGTTVALRVPLRNEPPAPA